MRLFVHGGMFYESPLAQHKSAESPSQLTTAEAGEAPPRACLKPRIFCVRGAAGAGTGWPFVGSFLNKDGAFSSPEAFKDISLAPIQCL